MDASRWSKFLLSCHHNLTNIPRPEDCLNEIHSFLSSLASADDDSSPGTKMTAFDHSTDKSAPYTNAEILYHIASILSSMRSIQVAMSRGTIGHVFDRMAARIRIFAAAGCVLVVQRSSDLNAQASLGQILCHQDINGNLHQTGRERSVLVAPASDGVTTQHRQRILSLSSIFLCELGVEARRVDIVKKPLVGSKTLEWIRRTQCATCCEAHHPKKKVKTDSTDSGLIIESPGRVNVKTPNRRCQEHGRRGRP